MKDDIGQRINMLLEEGRALVNGLPRDQHGVEPWVRSSDLPSYQSWLSSVTNLLRVVAGAGSYYVEEANRLMEFEASLIGLQSHAVQKVLGLLTSAAEEWKHGLLRKIEFIVAALTFDEFLDHASDYHKGGKKTEAAILASAVLEDAVKRVAQKNNVPFQGRTLDPLLDDLGKAGVLTPVKVKRLKANAGVRNHALHAEWDKFELDDVADLIAGTRGLIEDYL